jgi:hypothetical protein
MAAARAAGALRAEPRHRAQIGRFLGRKWLRQTSPAVALRAQLLGLESRQGTFVFIVDQTLASQQGHKTENTYSTGNRQRRPRKGRRYGQYQHARKSCHCFVFGLLLTPSGFRLPFARSYYTQTYCQAKGKPYRTQTQLAAELVAELPLPAGAAVVVLGDTAFEAKCMRQACAARGYDWLMPLNPERVLAGPRGQRPQVRTLVTGLAAEQWVPVRFHATQGAWVAYRRLSPRRVGPKVKPRTYYVQTQSREVHSLGAVRLVFSTPTLPTPDHPLGMPKILVTNRRDWDARQIVELYSLRWQIELFFKELKSTLGFHQYRFQSYERVEGWLELAQVTVLYLEWYRARQLRRRALPAAARRWWQRQRLHGLCLAARQAAEQADLQTIARRLETPTGLKSLRKLLKGALAKEDRFAA